MEFFYAVFTVVLRRMSSIVLYMGLYLHRGLFKSVCLLMTNNFVAFEVTDFIVFCCCFFIVVVFFFVVVVVVVCFLFLFLFCFCFVFCFLNKERIKCTIQILRIIFFLNRKFNRFQLTGGLPDRVNQKNNTSFRI